MKLPTVLTAPGRDFWTGFQRSLDHGPKGLLMVIAGLWLSWWIYVPIHELLHAAGCLVAGGDVTRLEIDAMYGGSILAQFIPWVYSGSDYAGQLTGFDTKGSDLIYLATDFGPYLLTVFPGVWALRRAGRTGKPFLYGASLPLALAPFISITFDAYEVGSILATQIPPWSSPDLMEVLRGDDLFLQAGRIAEVEAPPWGGFALATSLGIAWAFATYALGTVFAGRPAATKGS